MFLHSSEYLEVDALPHSSTDSIVRKLKQEVSERERRRRSEKEAGDTEGAFGNKWYRITASTSS